MLPRNKGQFQKGHHYSPETEFKEGDHWREEKPFWNEEWLKEEYHNKDRSAKGIAEQFDVTEGAILYWLKKLDIPRKTMSEIRERKHWGASGEDNPMYGATGDDNPNWKGGVTPERQAFYQSKEWADACQEVWKRDDATCQRCGVRKGEDIEFHIHHIESFANKEKRSDVNNLVLLCQNCHNWVHNKANKDNKFLNE